MSQPLVIGGDGITNCTADDLKEISTGYTPRPLQERLHQSLKRFNVVVCHRRFGKTVFSINHMIDRALRCPLPMPRFAYIAPTYGQAKRVVWDLLKYYTKNIPGVQCNEAELRVDFPAVIPGQMARISLLSAENYPTLKGIYLDGVVLDEFAEMNPAAWSEAIRPTLSDRRGWAIFIGTPKGQNNFYELYQFATSGQSSDWYGALYRASETNLISVDELKSAKMAMTEEEYEQEYECSFVAALTGAYFAKELAKAEREGRLTTIRHDSLLPVDTAWDLGWNDTTAIWFFQSIRGEHRFIDYYEVSGTKLPDIAAEISRKHYKYGRILLPHDGDSGNLQTGRTPRQILRPLLPGANVEVIPRVKIKRESIDAARIMLPTCVFDKERCGKGLKALLNYQRKFDNKNNVFAETPMHNWASNGADAFQQFALGCRSDSRNTGVNAFSQREGVRPAFQAVTEYNPFEV